MGTKNAAEEEGLLVYTEPKGFQIASPLVG